MKISFHHKINILENFISNKSGQAVVELAIMLPIILIIAVIAVNALTFFSECSSFDRTFKQIVSCTGTSPAYGMSTDNTVANVKQQLYEKFDKEFLDFDVDAQGKVGGLTEFCGSIKMHPTLFGLGLKSDILGVPLPSLNHEQKITIEEYKPGVIF